MTVNQERIKALKDLDLSMAKNVYKPLAHDIMNVVLDHTKNDNTVPIQDLGTIRKDVQKITRGYFVTDGKPYLVTDKGIKPNSPYTTTIFKSMLQISKPFVKEQADLMVKYLPETAIQQIKKGNKNPFLGKPKIKEFDDKQLSKTLLSLTEYDPSHEWVDPSGKTLSERIWDTDEATREKLDGYLSEAIKQGKSSIQMQKELQDFLFPDRTLTTTKPYGTNASFDGMRLARTEIASAGHRASSSAAIMNPFVNEFNIVVSPIHGCCDICDDVADEGPYDKFDTDMLPPGSTHPQCICTIRWVQSVDHDLLMKSIMNDLTSLGDNENDTLFDYVSPLNIDNFLQLLFSFIF